jgi:transposase
MGASERDERARSQWRLSVAAADPARLRFVDECGSNIALSPICARAPRGERAMGSAPRNYGKNTTLIAEMSLRGMGEAMTLEGAVDGDAFEAYVRHLLAPSLEPGDIVVMDNLSVHKRASVRELIEEKGCSALFLPPYSPDLNPIEHAFSKLKAILRSKAARTREALEKAIAEALSAVTASDALGWFRHCGHQTKGQSFG